jgi:hypothetical protein
MKCVNNRVTDGESCGFLKAKFRVDDRPDPREMDFDIPAEFQDKPRLKVALQEAAVLNGAGGEAPLEGKCQAAS